MSLFGFVDLGEIDTNYATLKDVQQLATHVLVFLVKSIVNPFSFSLATFTTNGATAYQIFPIFWKAVNILENMDLKSRQLLLMELLLSANFSGWNLSIYPYNWKGQVVLLEFP